MQKLSKLEANLLILGIFLCMEIGLMVAGEFSVALPKIIANIGGAELYALIFAANTVTGAIISPIAGKLSDIFGRRVILLWASVIILASEIFAGFAQNIYQMIILRGIQGFGGAATVVVGLIVISDIFDKETRAKYLGYYGSMQALTSIVAPIVGGIIVQTMSWRWIFFSIVPVGLLGIALVIRYMPHIETSKNTKIDYLGLVFFSLATSMIVVITTLGGSKHPWGSPTMLGIYAITAAAFVLFVIIEKNVSNPMIPLSLFRHRVFNVCLISVIFCTAGVMALMFYLPLFGQKVMGLTPTQSALFTTERAIISLFISTLSGMVVARLKYFKWNAVVATIMFSITLFVFSTLTGQSSIYFVMLLAGFWGLANGVLTGIFQTGVQMSLPGEEMAVAMGTIQLGVTLGATVAAAVFGIFLKTPVLAVGITNVFKLAGILVALSLVLLVLFVRKKPSDQNIASTSSSAA